MTTLRIAIQKSGRLNEDSVSLLKECGISIYNGNDQLKAQATNFPLEVLYLRNSDIPQYVQDGVAHCAILGENVVVEKKKKIEIVEKLGFSKCRLSMAVPKGVEYNGVSWFNTKRIATSYPETLKDFMRQNNITADIHEISGSVEIAPNIGLADGICDLVSTGGTLFNNGLKEVETILHSEAVLVSNPHLDLPKRAILDKLLFRIRAVKKAKSSKYILLNIPNDRIGDIQRILPGMKSPTVLPLAEPGWSSVHSVVQEDHFWDIIEDLRAIGAQGILVVPIEKMIV